jgi:hypothetical protein
MQEIIPRSKPLASSTLYASKLVETGDDVKGCLQRNDQSCGRLELQIDTLALTP